jgi:hypothetical protein
MVARDLVNDLVLQPHEIVMKGALRGISMHMDERHRRDRYPAPELPPKTLGTEILIGPIPDPKDYAVGARLTLSHLGASATFERVPTGWVCAGSNWPQTTPVPPDDSMHKSHVPASVVEQAKAERAATSGNPITQAQDAVFRALRGF